MHTKNKIYIRYLSCCLLFFLLLNCVSNTKITYLNVKGLKAFYSEGLKYLHSKKANSVVTLGFQNLKLKNGQRTYISLTIQNLSKQSYTVNPEQDIQIVRNSKKDKVDIISYYDLIRDLKDQTDSDMWFHNLFSWLGSASYEPSSYYEVRTRNGKKTYYSFRKNRDSRLDRIEDQLEDAKRERYRERITKDFKIQKEELEKNILKRHTLFPNKKISGLVAVDWPKLKEQEDNFTITITAGKDRHYFKLKQNLLKR